MAVRRTLGWALVACAGLLHRADAATLRLHLRIECHPRRRRWPPPSLVLPHSSQTPPLLLPL